MHDQLVLVAAGLLFDLAARVDEIALAVEFADVPGRFGADPVDRADINPVGCRRGGLFQLPQVFRQPRHGGRGVDDVFRPVQRQRPPAFGKVAVVADIDPELAIGGLEHRVIRGPRLEEELLPEPGDMRDMGLAVFAKVGAVGVDHGGGVVIDPGHRLFIDRHHDHHGILFRIFLHQPGGRAIRDRLGGGIPLAVLAGAEIGLGKDLLHAQNLHPGLARSINQRQVRGNHLVADRRRRFRGIPFQRHLDQSTPQFRHVVFPFRFRTEARPLVTAARAAPPECRVRSGVFSRHAHKSLVTKQIRGQRRCRLPVFRRGFLVPLAATLFLTI